jgi:hypothetical protein
LYGGSPVVQCHVPLSLGIPTLFCGSACCRCGRSWLHSCDRYCYRCKVVLLSIVLCSIGSRGHSCCCCSAVALCITTLVVVLVIVSRLIFSLLLSSLTWSLFVETVVDDDRLSISSFRSLCRAWYWPYTAPFAKG